MTYVFSPCLAGLDPASHSVKTRRDVPLARLYRQDSMGLRVKPARTRVNERFGKNLEGLSKASRRKSVPN